MGPATVPTHPLDALFHARSVALVGLSGDPRKMTAAPLAILQQTGFGGTIYPVNPGYQELGGLRCYPDIDALPQPVDVAVIMLSAARVAQAIRACGRKGIPAAVVLSSGFEESEDGAAHAKALAQAAAETGIVVVGPNCEGLWAVRERVLLTFGSAARRSELLYAPVAIVSQSGAIAGALGRHLQDSGMGCAYVVSVGNETVLTIADYVEWMIAQEDLRVIVLFIEGLRDGRRLLGLIARAVARGIHVVVLKSGNSLEGMKAAASHTGKMASAYRVYLDLLDEAGAIQVRSLTDLIEAAEVLSVLPLPRQCGSAGEKGGVSVFSIPGGTRAMTADLLEQHQVPLATFSRTTVKRLANALPEFGGTENPTDLTGQVLSEPGLFETCLRIIADDPQTEALIVQVANRGPRDVTERVEMLGSVAGARAVPMVVSFLGDTLPAPEKTRLRACGIVCARDPAEAARFLGWLYSARARQSQQPTQPRAADLVIAAPRSWAEVVAFLQACSIDVPPWRVLKAGDDALGACAGIQYPVAVKAMPEDADHKTELGLVALDVHAQTLAAEVDSIRSRLARPQAQVLVQQMDRGGIEVLMSALRNPDFGPILAIGMGGTATELHGDVAYLALPTDAARVRRALSRLKLWTLLQGFRGKPAADIDALVDSAVAFGARFLAARPAIDEIEINPLFVRQRGAGVVAVDALVKAAWTSTP